MNPPPSPTESSSRRSNNGHLPQHVQLRNRSIAEREASRLARPDRPQSQSLAHANRSKSAVSSTPFGFNFNTSKANDKNDPDIRLGSSQYEDWCGPFSVARQMIASREQARRQRELEQQQREEEEQLNNANHTGHVNHPLDELILEAQINKKRKAHPSMTWKPRSDSHTASIAKDSNGKLTNLYEKRNKRIRKQKIHSQQRFNNKIPTLFQLCVNYIVDNFEYVESLGGSYVDNSIRKAICEALVANGKMNGAAFDTLAEEGIETLDIIDCTQVTSQQMSETLKNLIPSGLRALILNNAGRCFTSKAVQSIVDCSHIELFALSIEGAYLLKDADVAKLISVTAQTLTSIQLRACPLISLEFCNSIAIHYSSNTGAPGSCLLELVLEDIPSLTKGNLMTLASSSSSHSNALQHLKNLSLRGLDALDDEVVHSLLSSITCANLEGLDLSNNVHLTDQSLSSIRLCNLHGRLKSLKLSGISNLTSAGLEAFFTFDIPQMPNPPALRSLDLSNCDYEAVNESVVNLAIAASALKRQPQQQNDAKNNSKSNNNINKKEFNDNNISTMGGLISLDVSGGSVTDTNMEMLASTCQSSLKELKLNFCSNVTDNGLGYLVDNVNTQFSRIEIWGCAQITDSFLDGHSRVDEEGGGVDIVGVWMSKGNISRAINR